MFRIALSVSLSALLCLAAQAAEPAAAPKMSISAPAFGDKQDIPQEFTCEGANTSPQLVFEHVPAAAKSLVLIIEDPDAPDPKKPKLVWDHWLLYNLPPDTKGLPAGEPMGGKGKPTIIPKHTHEAKNSWKKTGYGGPCPPIGRHRYFHRLYALDTVLPDLKRPDKKALGKAMYGHVIAEAVLVGYYEKKNKKPAKKKKSK